MPVKAGRAVQGLKKEDDKGIQGNNAMWGMFLIGNPQDDGTDEVFSGSVVSGLLIKKKELFLLTSKDIIPSECLRKPKMFCKDLTNYTLQFKKEGDSLKEYRLYDITKPDGEVHVMVNSDTHTQLALIIPIDDKSIKFFSKLKYDRRPYHAKKEEPNSSNDLLCYIVNGDFGQFSVEPLSVELNNEGCVLTRKLSGKEERFTTLSQLTDTKNASFKFHPHVVCVLDKSDASAVGILTFVNDKIVPVWFSQLKHFVCLGAGVTSKAVTNPKDLCKDFTEQPAGLDLSDHEESTSISNSSLADETEKPKNDDTIPAARGAVCVKTPPSAKDKMPDQGEPAKTENKAERQAAGRSGAEEKASTSAKENKGISAIPKNKKESPGSKKKSPDKDAYVPENRGKSQIKSADRTDNKSGSPEKDQSVANTENQDDQKTSLGTKKNALDYKGTDAIPAGTTKETEDKAKQGKCVTESTYEKEKLLGELGKIASKKGFIISDNRGEGNCMFYVLAEQLKLVKGIQISHHELRRSIVQYIKKNPRLNGVEIHGFVADRHASLEGYLRSMEEDGTWGDEVILRAATNFYETCIRVISSSCYDELMFPECQVDENSKPLVLGHVHELHYVSLRPKQPSTSESKEVDEEVLFGQMASSRDEGQSTLRRRAPKPDAPGATTAGKSVTPLNQAPPLKVPGMPLLGPHVAASSSLDMTNKASLQRLLINGGTEALRRIFNTHHPPENLADDLNSNYECLNKLVGQRMLSPTQWTQLFPRNGATPNSETFDLFLLFVLLTNITRLPSSPCKNIRRLKFYYSNLHNDSTRTGIDTPTFSVLWEDISSVLLALGLKQHEIEHLKEPRGEDAYGDVLLSLMSRELQAFKSAMKSELEDVRRDIKDIREKMQGLQEMMQNITHIILTQSLIRESVSQPTQDGIAKKDAPSECSDDINNADDMDGDGRSDDKYHHLYMLMYCIILSSVLTFCT